MNLKCQKPMEDLKCQELIEMKYFFIFWRLILENSGGTFSSLGRNWWRQNHCCRAVGCFVVWWSICCHCCRVTQKDNLIDLSSDVLFNLILQMLQRWAEKGLRTLVLHCQPVQGACHVNNIDPWQSTTATLLVIAHTMCRQEVSLWWCSTACCRFIIWSRHWPVHLATCCPPHLWGPWCHQSNMFISYAW